MHESAYSASKFALCGWSEALAVDLYDTGRIGAALNPGPIDTEIWDRPDNDDPIYDGPKVAAQAVADGIIAAIERRRVRALPARHEGDRRAKTGDSTRSSPAWRNVPAMKALVFGVRPEPFEVPDAANPLLRTCDDTDRPAGHRRPRRCPRLGGHTAPPDRHLRLRHQADPAGLRRGRQRQRHERVMLVPPGDGPRGGGRRGRDRPDGARARGGAAVVLNPWLSCGPRGISPACPACEAGDYSLCWSFTDGDLRRASTPGYSTTRPAASRS